MKTSALKLNLLFPSLFLEWCVLSVIQEVISEKVPEGPGHEFLDPRKKGSAGTFNRGLRALCLPATMCNFKRNHFNLRVQLAAL